MKEPIFPPRLSESSSEPRLAEALRVAKSYQPAAARAERALARFEATRGSESAPGGSLQIGRSMSSLKAAALVAVAIAIGAGWALHRTTPDSPEVVSTTASPATATAMPTTAGEVVSPATTAPVEAKTMHVDELPTAAPAETAAPRVRPTTAEAAGTTASSFDDELALVEAARTSLAKGDAATCLSELDRYDRQIQAGVFEREVAVMRIEALLARGESARARTLGEAFLARTPDSPYANRVRSLLTKAAAEPSATP
ncbi:MAG: hypothetical protein KF795_29810 [Labilithrix sp.]|nr:hypothetical protein [Labilithrix sp.]